MIEIIPNWHPILVHFTFGLLVTAGALFAVGAAFRDRPFAGQATTVARWNLWIGTVFTVLTLVAGYRAYYTVAHDDVAHAAMNLHLRWAWATLVFFIVGAALAWRERARATGASLSLGGILVFSVGALLVTGYLGAENVYRHGLGVMRLAASAGPGHEHAQGTEGRENNNDGDAALNGAHQHGGHDHGASADEDSKEAEADYGAAMGRAHADAGRGNDGATAGTTGGPAAIADVFHTALSEGDLEAAAAQLDPGVRIFESGAAERSRAEYASHHMQEDAAFLKTTSRQIVSRTGFAADDLAWVATEYQITGMARGKRVEIMGVETMVLHRVEEAGWRIAHIHWSSQPSE